MNFKLHSGYSGRLIIRPTNAGLQIDAFDGGERPVISATIFPNELKAIATWLTTIADDISANHQHF